MSNFFERTVFALMLVFIYTGICFAEIKTSNLHLVEQNLFNTQFSKENLSSRLSRIEKCTFGRAYAEPIQLRLNRLNSLKDKLLPVQNTYGNFGTTNSQYTTKQNPSATDYPRITHAEGILFNKTYTQNDIYTRLTRLEKSLFGLAFTQEELYKRVDKISAAVSKASNSNNLTNSLNSNSYINASQISSADICEMEKRQFNRTYEKEDIITRLERLEANMFGAIQNGEIQPRIDQLKRVSTKNYLAKFGFGSNSSNSTYNQNEFFNSSNNSTGMLSGIGGKLKPFVNKIFGLGYTNSNPSFNDPFFNNSSNLSGPTSYQYNNNATNYNTGVGVRILD